MGPVSPYPCAASGMPAKLAGMRRLAAVIGLCLGIPCLGWGPDALAAPFAGTGHAALGQEPDLDWNALARPNQTVVVFMGVGVAGTIAARLIAAGRDPATPVAVVENGTRANEIVAFGPLGNVADVIYSAVINGPALLIIGISLRQSDHVTAAPENIDTGPESPEAGVVVGR